ncbi:MAG: hypothetical protein GX896_05180, partial [Clostridiales bacterium]|nr:hypothetical protein [Clostridiales bacterium]
MKLFKPKKKEVRLGFSNIGKAIINETPFSFGIESLGADSKGGFLLTISGDAVDNKNLVINTIEVHKLVNGKFDIKKYSPKLIEKKEGGFAYQLSLKNYKLTSDLNKKTSWFKRQVLNDSDFLKKFENEIQFKFVPKYKSGSNQEVLIAVFPFENYINGVASKWVT